MTQKVSKIPAVPERQYLANQLTLFIKGEGRLSPPITTGPSNFFSSSDISELSKSIFKKVRQKLICVSAKYVLKILPLMNHQPFFALLKVKLNSVCHKKIIDCLQKKREKKNLSVNKGKTTINK